MNTGSTSSLVLRDDSSRLDVQVALGGFLAGYSSNTYLAYQQDLRQFVSWCSKQDLDLFTLKRTHIERLAAVHGDGFLSVLHRRGSHGSEPGCERATTKATPGIHDERIGSQ